MMRTLSWVQQSAGGRYGAPELALMTAALLLTGCIGRLAGSGPPPREVSLAEFARPAPADAVRADGDLDEAPPSGADPGRSVSGLGARADAQIELPEPFVPPGWRPVRPGDRLIVESMVGHVNGRPIFADEFFEPIEDELERLAERTPPGQFAAEVDRIVLGWLREVVRNELFLAEAEAGLTPQQQQGLFAILRELQGEVIRQKGGSRAGAESTLLETEGLTLDEYMEAEKNRMLIAQLLYQKIRPRIVVSWRDVEREYQRRYHDFNPPATMVVLRIFLNRNDQADMIEEVKTRLARGDAFEEIAIDAGMREDLGRLTIELDEDGKPQVESEEYRRVLAGLGKGQTSEPIEVRRSTVWFHVASMDPPLRLSIFDPMVQQQLHGDIRRRRAFEEQQRYVESLFEKGIYDELDQMAMRLRRIALLRYGR